MYIDTRNVSDDRWPEEYNGANHLVNTEKYRGVMHKSATYIEKNCNIFHQEKTKPYFSVILIFSELQILKIATA